MNESFQLGFIKRAQDYGISEQHAIQLLKIAGPLGGLANNGVPSLASGVASGVGVLGNAANGFAAGALQGGNDPISTILNRGVETLKNPNAMNINSMVNGGLGAVKSMIPQFKNYIANNSGQFSPELVSRVAPTIDDGYLARQVK